MTITKRKDRPARLPRWPKDHPDECLCEACEKALYRRLAWWSNRLAREPYEDSTRVFDRTLARAVIEGTWEQLALFYLPYDQSEGDAFGAARSALPS